MKHCYLFLLLFVPSLLAAGDSATLVAAKQKKLRGYRQLFYRLVTLHPKLNSPLEKELLKHYLLGSGETFVVSEADFKRLQQTVPLYITNQDCKPLETNHPGYCGQYVNLHEDKYFGWGVGNLTVIYQTTDQTIVSFVDYYDFDKKKKGKRRVRNEFVTRVFSFLTPASSRSFVVTYNADAYFVKP
ncbi:hypothetical protein [Lacibacter sediminis]|uniref:Uncharacterized protein n=1 Tax=Lacibacter sediminis TaxID=2760713 RepID=A0A7G5XKR1_9BACT|nr:hypothetical protein [Lacibacter sediminis]QNA46064.1 hypothetical protein H4075_07740 [Lacibacter sediminis]